MTRVIGSDRGLWDNQSLLIQIKLKRLSPEAIVPTKGTIDSAYYDVYATEAWILRIGEVRAISTGWAMEVPPGWFLDIRPRSGKALVGITINNTPGTFDSDFRGQLKIILINHLDKPFPIKVGDRIAQCAPMPVWAVEFVECDELSETVRGEDGFGSTG